VNKLILPKRVSVKNSFASDGTTPYMPKLAEQTEAFEGVEYIYE
jgi:hypothetical protein